jgi:site-specific recombinase XerD
MTDDPRDLATDAEWLRHARFLNGLKERGRRMATLEAYDKDWRALARWYLDSTGGCFDLATFTPMDGADFLGFLIRTSKPATVARRLQWLRSYATFALRAKETSEELHDRLDQLRPPKPQAAAPRGLSVDEARAALRAVEQRGSARDKAMLFVFLLTGIRVGELVGLEVRDLTIGERSGAVLVRAEVAKGGREREVPLPKDARTYLQEYLAGRTDGSPALFVGQRGRMTPSGVRLIVAGYAGVPPHRLRHTFAYEYLRTNQNDLVALADILGHASLNTTRTYTRRRKEDLEQGVERVRYEKTPRRVE